MSLMPRPRLVVVLCVAFGVAACGKQEQPQPNYFDPNAQQAAAPQPTPPPPAPEPEPAPPPPAPAPPQPPAQPSEPEAAEPQPAPTRPRARLLVHPEETKREKPQAVEPATAEDRLGQETAVKAIGPNTSSADLMVLVRTHENKYVRGYAAELLGDRGLAQAADVLYAAMDDAERYVQRRAAVAAARVAPCTIPQQLLQALRSSRSTTRFVAIGAATEALQLCEDRPLPALKPLQDALVELLRDPDPQVRAEAVTLFGRLEDPERAEQRRRLLTDALNDGASGVRLAAIRALGTDLTHEAVRRIIGLMDDADPLVQRQAIVSLANSGNREGLEAVRKRIHDPDSGVRVRVVQALGSLRDPDTLDDLIELLRDTESEVRYEAVKAVAKVAPEDAPFVLMQMLEDRDTGVRHVSAYNLAELCPVGDAEVARGLAAATADRDEAVALEALRALRCMGAGDCVPELVEALCRARSRTARDEIAALLDRTTRARITGGCSGWRTWLQEEGATFQHQGA